MSFEERAEQVVTLGGGGHGRVLLDALRAAGRSVVGVLDPRVAVRTILEGVPVLGGDEWLDEPGSKALLLVNGIGANPATTLRRVFFERWKAEGYEFATVVHPSAVVAASATLSEGVQLLARAVVQSGAALGQNVVVNTAAVIEHNVRIGAHAFIAPGAVICGDVVVGAGAFIGAGAVVVPGVRIGADAVVAAGATLVRDVGAGERVAGSPARLIGQ